jgi:chromosome partitioning protein
MIITIASLKGGVGKTTTAFHFAAIANEIAPTVLVDGDPNRSAIAWSQQNDQATFTVISEKQLPKYGGKFENIVIDTQARPTPDDFRDLVEASDLIVLPTPPTFLDLSSTLETVQVLSDVGSTIHRVLLTKVPTNTRSTDEADARAFLCDHSIAVFAGRIRFYKAFERAALGGVEVGKVKGDRNSKLAWNDYQAVVREAIEVING